MQIDRETTGVLLGWEAPAVPSRPHGNGSLGRDWLAARSLCLDYPNPNRLPWDSARTCTAADARCPGNYGVWL